MVQTKSKASAARIQGILSDVSTKGRGLRPAMVIHGAEKVGKTSFAAMAKNPVFLMSHGEIGLETLIDHGQLGDVPHLPEIKTWPRLLESCEALRDEDHKFDTAVLDTANGMEDLLYDFVCETEYNGDRGPRGFLSYMQGYQTATPHWQGMLRILDELREKRNMTVILLCHTQIKSFKNPAGQDYDRYQPQMHARQWGATHKWADVIMFMDTVTVIDEDGNRPKAVGGTQRIARCERSAAWDAGNRYGLKEFSLGNSAAEGWKNFMAAMKKARKE